MSELINKTQELTDALRQKSLERLKKRLEKDGTDQLLLAKGMIAAFTDELAKMPSEIVDVFKSALEEVTGESDLKTLDRLDDLINTMRAMERQFGALLAQKDVRVSNLGDLKLPTEVTVANLDKIKFPQQEKLTFPKVIEAVILKQIDVNQIEANSTEFDRDTMGRIRQIVEVFDTFRVIYTYNRDQSSNRIRSIVRTVA